ncbi:hypothetical protein CDD83_5563 [Cordyceps sp. RAO-2017]|nr:hypothetical protein CDD83_5563 [Cordyceps sp. RAO-2017]
MRVAVAGGRPAPKAAWPQLWDASHSWEVASSSRPSEPTVSQQQFHLSRRFPKVVVLVANSALFALPLGLVFKPPDLAATADMLRTPAWSLPAPIHLEEQSSLSSRSTLSRP